MRRFADNRRAHEDACAQDAPAAAERACAARDARHARHAREAAVAADDESTGKPEQRAVNEPVPELEQPCGPIGHRPERRVAIGIAAAKPGGEQDEPEQRAAVTATGEPGAEPEQRARELIEPEQHVPGGEQAESKQRVAITAADEPGQRARKQIQLEQEQHAPSGKQDETAPFEPEQHAAANEPEQRAAITIAAEPGSAPVEQEQHAAADEPLPPLAPQPGELSEREVDHTVAAQPGEFVGLGQPAISAAADPDSGGSGTQQRTARDGH